MIGCIIQARMGSTRLPGKVMMPADKDNPMLFSVIKQIEKSKLIEKIVVATTELDEDHVIEKFLDKLDITCFRGNSEDVLDRYYNCAQKFSFSTIVRITGDCPLNDYNVIDKTIKGFLDQEYDYMSNSRPVTYPYGISVEVFSFNALKKAWKEAKKPSEREHVTPYFYNHPEKFHIGNIKYKKNISKIRIMVDHKEDLVLVREVFKNIQKRPILLEDIIEYFKDNEELIKINQNFLPNEGFLKSLNKDKEFLKSIRKIKSNEKN